MLGKKRLRGVFVAPPKENQSKLRPFWKVRPNEWLHFISIYSDGRLRFSLEDLWKDISIGHSISSEIYPKQRTQEKPT